MLPVLDLAENFSTLTESFLTIESKFKITPISQITIISSIKKIFLVNDELDYLVKFTNQIIIKIILKSLSAKSLRLI
jgi:hypothetical protein